MEVTKPDVGKRPGQSAEMQAINQLNLDQSAAAASPTATSTPLPSRSPSLPSSEIANKPKPKAFKWIAVGCGSILAGCCGSTAIVGAAWALSQLAK